MVRFSASERDIEQMLRFLSRRMPGGVRLVPLQAAHRDELRWRRTVRPLMTFLRDQDGATAWGIREAAGAGRDSDSLRLAISRDAETGMLHVDPDASYLITLAFGPADGPDRRRDSILIVRDWDREPGPQGTPPDPEAARRAPEARNVVERTARHLRRGAVREDGRWVIGGAAG